VSIADASRRSHEADCDFDIGTCCHQLVITRFGAALAHRVDARQSDLVTDPLQAVLLEAGARYSMRRPSAAPHAYTVFSFAPSALPSDTHAPIAKHHLIRADVLLRYHRLRQTLLGLPHRNEASALSVEEEAITLLRSATQPAAAAPGTRMRRHRDLAESAKMVLASAPGAAHPLDQVAAALGVSPSHLAHVFRAEVGIPMHQYLLQLRMAIAVDNLSGGIGNLSQLALDLGFVSHSHFTAAFRQSFGVPPRAARDALAVTR
jgi:AraC-like DNA-binding protein